MTGPPTSREVAIGVLVRVDHGAYANLVLPSVLRETRLDTRDRAFTTDLVYGTLRRRGSIDFLLAPTLDRPLDALDPPVRAALRVGVYQLVEGIPAHAAVGETVTAATRRSARARGFVNAVLRRVAALGPAWPWPSGDDLDAIAARSSHPPWLVGRLLADLGPRDTYAMLDCDNEPPAVTLRVDPRRSTPDALARELREVGVDDVRPGELAPGALVVQGAGDLARLAAIADGRATPQDQASQAVVDILAPRPGEQIVDLAAAPGGKSGAIAERVGDHGFVVAVDVNRGRLRLVRDTAARTGGLAAVRADGRRPPLRAGTFDRVLVDAPCSGLGVLRRRPDARWRVRPDAATELATLQRDLLAAGAALARPGGVVVYAVCTVTWEETRAVDAWATAGLPHLTARPSAGPPWRPWGRGSLLLPHVAGTDGMYVLALEKGR